MSKYVLGIFRGPKMPKPAAAPAAPIDNGAAQRKRDAAAKAAEAEALAGGRRSTMVSGIQDEDAIGILGGPQPARVRGTAAGFLSQL